MLNVSLTDRSINVVADTILACPDPVQRWVKAKGCPGWVSQG